MSFWNNLINNLPEVKGPEQRRLSFKEKLKWTGVILGIFFVLGLIPLFGLGSNALQQFEFLSIILGAKIWFNNQLGYWSNRNSFYRIAVIKWFWFN